MSEIVTTQGEFTLYKTLQTIPCNQRIREKNFKNDVYEALLNHNKSFRHDSNLQNYVISNPKVLDPIIIDLKQYICENNNKAPTTGHTLEVVKYLNDAGAIDSVKLTVDMANVTMSNFSKDFDKYMGGRKPDYYTPLSSIGITLFIIFIVFGGRFLGKKSK